MGVIIKQSIRGTVINYVGIFIGFLSTFFVSTKYLTEAEIGVIGVLIAAATLFSGFAQIGTGSSIIRFFPHFKNVNNKDNGYFFWALIIPMFGFVVFTVLYLLFKHSISDYFSEQSGLFVNYYYWVIPLSFFMMYMAVFEAYANVLMNIAFAKLVREVILRLFLLINYLLYAFDIISFNGVIYLFCISYGLATVLNLGFLIRLKKISLKPNMQIISNALRNEYVRYAIYSLVIVFGTTLAPLLSTFFIAGELGLSETGVFSIATYIAVIVEIPYRSLGTIALPQLSQNIRENDLEKCNALCKSVSLHQLIAGSFILLLLWCNIDVIFRMIPNGDVYSAGKWVVLILGVAKLINSVCSFGASALTYSKFFYYSIVFAAIITFSAFAFNVILIPIWDINGSALSVLFSTALYSASILAFVMYKIKINLFSVSHIKVLLVVLALFVLNFLIDMFAGAIIDNGSFVVAFVVSGSKTLFLGTLGVSIIYWLNVSGSINKIIDSVLKFNKKDNYVKGKF